MYQALYRKYRPMTFGDVCGQDHITSVLKTQIAQGRVSHAYMFCGCRGTGKTTCAKIFARAVNCEHPVDGEPCNDCPSCTGIREERIFDVVEMDAASNNSVDNVRAIIDEVQYLPTEVKKKVYIIDEVHMLSPSAFNALLKTIEEPPEHVIFIFATTEMNKVPATILSRCQRFDFKRITQEIIRDRVLFVSEKEGIPLTPDAAEVISRLADGAMRDAMSLLEVCQGHSEPIDRDGVRRILGLGSRETVISLCSALAAHDAARALKILNGIYQNRSDFKQIIGDLIRMYRDLLILSTVPGSKDFVDLDGDERAALEDIASGISPEDILYQSGLLEAFFNGYDRIATDKKASGEILMIRLCRPQTTLSVEGIAARIAAVENRLDSGAPILPKREKAPSPEKKAPPAPVTDLPVPGTPYPQRAKLKNLLQNEKSIKYLLQNVSFVQDGTVLRVIAPEMTLGMIRAARGDELILGCAKELTPEITSVVMEPAASGKKSADDGLEDL